MVVSGKTKFVLGLFSCLFIAMGLTHFEQTCGIVKFSLTISKELAISMGVGCRRITPQGGEVVVGAIVAFGSPVVIGTVVVGTKRNWTKNIVRKTKHLRPSMSLNYRQSKRDT